MFRHKTPYLIQKLFPKLTWRKPHATHTIYLTFDDGPVPQATPTVLYLLRKYQAQATFFCVGENIEKHEEVFKDVVADGHSVGNHTHNHLDGWRCSTPYYLKNIQACQQRIDSFYTSDKLLLRPPYGRIKRQQVKSLLSRYDIVMWDVLSGDFAKKTSAQKCLQKSRGLTESGSIVVFHDSVKTIDKLNFVLPRFLHYFSARGFAFEAL